MNQQPHQQPQPGYQPQPMQQPGYGLPPKKRGNNLVTLGVFALIVVVVGGGLWWAVGRMQDQRAAEAAAEQQARSAANDKVAEHIKRASNLRGEGKLEEAVRELEAAVGNVGADDAVRMEAHKLLKEVGAEYGKQFEPKVTELIARAETSLAAGDADAAEKHLKEATALRYAPNADAASKLLALVIEARSEAKMKSFVLAMSDNEFAAFRKDLVLPERPAFERPALDSIFKSALKLNHDKAAKWLEEGKAERERERTRQQQELNAKMAEAEKAALDGKFTHDGYTKAGFVLLEDGVPVQAPASVAGWYAVSWNGHDLFAATFVLRNGERGIVQRDTVVYFHQPSKPRSIDSRYSKVIGFRQDCFYRAATESVKPFVAGQPMMYLLFSNIIGKSDAEKQLDRLVKAVGRDFDGKVREGAKSPAASKSDAAKGFQLRVSLNGSASSGTVETIEAVPVGLALDFRASK